ncbi:NACHT domain-containing protein [Saccharothrix carnea]|uniref:NACHT domain-containing protein n=1 Tax=Saccharothrix carnea TaxID=1280637 RepID=A0A2P8IH93_SACCR|nr:NACHT domain-containing protein [Saccharothrix carnea]PSL57848.1 NACHT domain-containing protein [Saccharothrix carnea]
MDARRLGRTTRLVALIAVGGVTGLVLVPVAINAATGGSALPVLGPHARWLWPALVVLSALTACLAAWDRLGALLVRRRPAHPANRRVALDRVERYVRDRVDGSLAEQLRLKLGVVPRVGPRLSTRLRNPVVVTGEPGAGKTTLLLELAEALLARAALDPVRPIPVVVDLGGWRRDDDFGRWLLGVLADRYRIAPRVGRAWLRERNLVLLFDGLDDLAPADRVECLAWITALNVPQVVLCTASDEHEHLPRYDVVPVEPLSRTVVQELIAACGPRLDGLHDELEKNPDLWDELRTPLAFGLLALAYRAGRAEYRGVLDTYVVESAARGAVRPERTVRALRFLARIARRKRDLVARSRLPARHVWLDFVGPEVVWRMFRRAAPGALAGAAAALCFVVGLRLGLVAAGVAAVATVLVPHSTFRVTRGDPRRGNLWAATGFVAGAVVTGGVALLGGVIGTQIARWPWAVGFGVVVVVSLVVAYGTTRDRYLAVACELVPIGVMAVVGPAEVVAGLGIGLGAGAVAGAFVGGLREVWSGLRVRPATGLRWLPAAGAAGVGLAALAGAGVRPSALGAVTGVLVGLAVTPILNRPFHLVAELLARPLALDEFPLRRKAVLQSARDRVLLVDEHRFPHDVVRDHLAECDPAELAASVEHRRAALSAPTGSGPRA